MSLNYTTLDYNTWYGVQNMGTGYDLGSSAAGNGVFIGQDGSFPLWQFADPQPTSVSGGTAYSYLLRPQAFGHNYNGTDYCVNVDPTSGDPILTACESTSTIWFVLLGPSGAYYELFATNLGTLGYNNQTGGALALYPSSSLGSVLPQNYQWKIQSISPINNPSFSSIYFGVGGSPQSTATTATTSATIVTSTSAPTSVPATSTPTTGSPQSSTVQATSSNTAAVTASGITTATFLPGSTVTSASFSTAIISKTLSASNFAVPSDVSIKCIDCSISANYDYQVGQTDSIDNFFEHGGFVELDFSNLDVTVALDIQLQSGYQPVDLFFPLFTLPLSNVIVGNGFALDMVATIGVPIQVAQNSPAGFAVGFTYALPHQATVLLSASANNDSITGFGAGTFTTLPFNISAPDITVAGLTGMALRLAATPASPHAGTTVSGAFTVDVYPVHLNYTVTPLRNVASNCGPVASGQQSFQYAALTDFVADAQVDAQGAIVVGAADGSHTWSAPALPTPTIAAFAGNQQCYASDSTKSNGAVDGRRKGGVLGVAASVAALAAAVVLCVL